MIQMFAIKCNEGYIRVVNGDEPTCVSLMKATVFGKEGIEEYDKVIENAKEKGFTQIRIIELQIIEKDPLNIK